MSTLGDHDLHEERVYRDFFVEWNQRATGLECEGKWGVASVCRYRGIVFFGLVRVLVERHEFCVYIMTIVRTYRASCSIAIPAMTSSSIARWSDIATGHSSFASGTAWMNSFSRRSHLMNIWFFANRALTHTHAHTFMIAQRL